MKKFNNVRFANNVRTLVKRKGMNLGDFERKVGVWAGYTSRIEKTGFVPSVDLVIKMASTLGVSINELVYKNFTPPKTVQTELYESDYKNIEEVGKHWGCSPKDVIHKFFEKDYFKEEGAVK